MPLAVGGLHTNKMPIITLKQWVINTLSKEGMHPPTLTPQGQHGNLKQGGDHFNFKGHYEYNGELYSSLSALAKAMGLIKQTAYNRVKAGLVKFIPKPTIAGRT